MTYIESHPDIDWHRYCEKYDPDKMGDIAIVGVDIKPGDWLASDGYYEKCLDQDHPSHKES